MQTLRLIGCLVVFCASALCAAEKPETFTQPRNPVVRIKDLAEIQGVRGNQLVGNGIVIGLDASGDSTSNALGPQSLANLVQRFGLKVDPATIKAKNIAAVLVTATLPPFYKKGSAIDVQVSSIGDATSLQGGILLQTPLIGADSRVYAVAQGALSVGGFSAGGGGGGGATIQKNHPLVGRVPGGALVEREVPSEFAANGVVRLRLRIPDFTTAQRMTDCINAKWPDAAVARDLSEVQVIIPTEAAQARGLVGFVSELESLSLSPDVRAKVVINERTGTIVAGADVRIAPTAISHGNLFITVKNTTAVSQPDPLSKGTTVVTNDQQTFATEEQAKIMLFQPGPTLGELARALNQLKMSPRDIIAIFQALKDAGALHAELIIM